MRLLNKYVVKKFFLYFSITLIYLMGSYILYFLIKTQEYLTFFKIPFFEDSFLIFSVDNFRYFIKLVFLRIPSIFTLVLPAAVFLASLLSIRSMEVNNEITALRSAGISFFRIILPLLVCGIILALLCFITNEKIVPLATHTSECIIREMFFCGEVYIIHEDPVETGASDSEEPKLLFIECETMSFLEKYTMPFACFVMILLGSSLGLKISRRGKIISSVCIPGIIFIYYSLIPAGIFFAKYGILPPFMGALCPVFVTGIAGLILFLEMNCDFTIR